MDETQRSSELVDGLITRTRTLDDDDLDALAGARAAVDETFHVGAWRGAMEHAATRSGVYAAAWVRLGACYIPKRLDVLVQAGSSADPDQLAAAQTVARLAHLAIDDALLALLGADSIRPPDIRELMAPWKAMLQAHHDRSRQSE